MRVAFVTTEYVSEQKDFGGLGNYLSRICRVLVDRGHDAEVFVTADRAEDLTIEGVLVHRVDWARWRSCANAASGLARLLPRGAWAVRGSGPILAQAIALARALRRRESVVRFDFVQSPDYQAAGLFVRKRPDRPHILRSSSPSDLWRNDRWQFLWERAAMRRVDRVYAPSRFVADHLRSTHRIDAGVVRPPFFMDARPAAEARHAVPSRYLMHFGYIGPNKGSEFLAAALPLVWRRDPSVRMVWVGRSRVDLDAWRTRWRPFSDNVTYLGAVEKPDLYRILSAATASVLPSKVDNLPNTAIESLMYDKPVIGTTGTSIDEIVRDGANGLLVPFGDTEALADAILRVWQQPLFPSSGLAAMSPAWAAMQPDAAIAELFRFALGSRGAPAPEVRP